ncbi:ABC transporter permease [Sediminivirga luteola]|uniref:ABC transporter permease n=1 Tax=Sediminivirga luteola TaxID=1774748 RepID=UPI001F58809F|nr:ABC transporter permease [Sediminivirga luteola]MCI2265199.1 ABC transporter permease [Sediminivirga luteola]
MSQATPSRRSVPGRTGIGPGLFLLLSWTVIATVLAAWTAVTALGLAPAALPSPTAVWARGEALFRSGALGAALLASLGRVAAGVALGTFTGLLLGVGAGLSRYGEALVDRPMQMLRVVPFTALTPLFVLALGVGEPMKIIVIAYAVAIPLYINTFAGIRDVDRNLVDVARVYRLSRARIAGQVLLLGALPQVLTGLRFSLGIAWVALVTVEVIGTRTGLGFLLEQGQQYARPETVLLVIVVYGLLGALTDSLVKLLERRLLRWRNAYSGG